MSTMIRRIPVRWSLWKTAKLFHRSPASNLYGMSMKTPAMTAFTPGNGIFRIVTEVPGTTDALSGATPLAYLKAGVLFDLKALFLGNTMGCIGEVSAIAILAGGLFLLAMKVIRIRIPGSYIGTFALLTLITALVRRYDAPLLFTLQCLARGSWQPIM